MKLLKRLGILTLCIGLVFSGNIVSASDWNLPTIGKKLPGGIPASGRQYIVYLKVTDADTGEEVDTSKYNRPYDWYVPTYVGTITGIIGESDSIKRVKVSYRLGEWEGNFDENGDINGEWFNVTDLIEKEVDVTEGWNLISIDLNETNPYEIRIHYEIKAPNLSNNNNLDSLEVERGTLIPEFSIETTEYALQVDEDVDEITIHVKPQHVDASVAQQEIITPLSKGQNNIGITVKAPNGDQKRYSILITRGDPNAEKTDDKKEDDKADKNQASSGGGTGRYSTTRDMGKFTSIPHVATKVATTPVATTNATLPVEEALMKLTEEQKAQIVERIKQKLPYTSLGYTLKAEELKTATQTLFTDEQIGKILASPQMVEQLGVRLNELITTISLNNTGGVSYSDISETHDAKTAIQEAISLGILESTEDGKFYPDSPIKFGDAFKYLDRVLLLNHIEGMKLGRATVESFYKKINIPEYPYVGSVASKLQIKTAKDLANMQIDGNIARQDMAQVIYEITEGKLATNNEQIYMPDISDNTYEPALSYCIKAGLMELKSPSQSLTKAEEIQILMKLNKAIKNMQVAEAKAAAEAKQNENVIVAPEGDPIAVNDHGTDNQ